MKLLVVSSCYPRRSQRNNGIFIHRQTRALVDLGFECHVVQPVDWAPPRPFERFYRGWAIGRDQIDDVLPEVDGIPVHHPRVFHPVPSRFFPGDTWERVGRAIGTYVERRADLASADLVVAHFLCHEGFAALVASQRLGIPMVAVARGDDVHAWPERWPDRKPKLAAVLSNADGLVACSAGLARDAASWAKDGLSTPFEVVYNGVDTEMFRPAANSDEQRAARRAVGLPTEGRLLLCVATPIDLKGWPELLDAFASMAGDFREWMLAMVGAPRGADDLNLTDECARRGLADRAVWLGQVPPERMPDLYRSADAFVLASHNEGLSNAVVEAMATGIAVVATDVGGHRELVDDGRTGRLVPRCDRDALESALRRVLEDRDYAAALGNSARRRAVEHGSFRANAARFAEYLRAVADRAQTRHVSGQQAVALAPT